MGGGMGGYGGGMSSGGMGTGGMGAGMGMSGGIGSRAGEPYRLAAHDSPSSPRHMQSSPTPMSQAQSHSPGMGHSPGGGSTGMGMHGGQSQDNTPPVEPPGGLQWVRRWIQDWAISLGVP
ncbi:hypothetical protein WMY93_027761 [Mugilogobius chulae]|uniref:Uncharacterized protein n=1 Tax=Mugilogobius chulae TaxID=88201 RepID=A0AAW0MYH5_9GOBI